MYVVLQRRNVVTNIHVFTHTAQTIGTSPQFNLAELELTWLTKPKRDSEIFLIIGTIDGIQLE